MRKNLLTIFPALAQAACVDYISQGVHGGAHDFYHALTVAQYAALIAPTERMARFGWCAGLLHEHPHRLYSEEQGAHLVRERLAKHSALPSRAQSDILQAVLAHSGKDTPQESPLLVVLKDADQLANLGAWHWLRAAQFRPNIPAVDPRYVARQDPLATFKNPRSVLRDIESTLEWETWLRLPKAKELAAPLFEEIRWLKRRLEERLVILGLVPFPAGLAVEVP